MEIILHIPDDVIENFQSKLSIRTEPTDIAKDAIDLYRWVVNERANGRILMSTNDLGTNFTKLSMPSLESI